MKKNVLEENYYLFPLKRLLSKNPNNEGIDLSAPPPILLSQIEDIPKGLVEQLEKSGVYDSEDLLAIKNTIPHHLGIDIAEFNILYDQVLKVSSSKIEFPKIILNLPENYALISVASDEKNNTLALLWQDVLFSFSNPVSEGWSLTKLAFDRLYVKLECPELIGSVGSSGNTPLWVEFSDISTYVSGLIPGEPIYEKLKVLGYPGPICISSPQKNSLNNTLELAYILKLASESSKKVILATSC